METAQSGISDALNLLLFKKRFKSPNLAFYSHACCGESKVMRSNCQAALAASSSNSSALCWKNHAQENSAALVDLHDVFCAVLHLLRMGLSVQGLAQRFSKMAHCACLLSDLSRSQCARRQRHPGRACERRLPNTGLQLVHLAWLALLLKRF